jgi:hypothetical protein
MMKSGDTMRGVTSVMLVVLALMMSIGLAVASGPIPSNESHTGYFHCEDEEGTAGELWINAADDDNESAPSNHRVETSPGFTDWTYGFPVRESNESAHGLEEDMYFDEEDSVASFRVRIEFAQGDPSEIQFDLSDDTTHIDDVTLAYTSSGVYTGEFEIPAEYVVDAGHELNFGMRWTLATGDNEWTIHMNDESYVDLPIADDFDNDGAPNYLDEDDDDDGHTDEAEGEAGTDPLDPTDYPGASDNGDDGDDDDDDAFPGFEAPLVMAGVVVAIVLIKRRR